MRPDKVQPKQVVLQGMNKSEARNMLNNMGEPIEAAKIRDAVITLKPVVMDSFRVEYAVKGDDLIFHFYIPPRAEQTFNQKGAKQAWLDYFLNRFKDKLVIVLQEYFECGAPRLQAMYTEEIASWFIKAQGFGNSADPDLLCRRFFEKLDAALQKKDGS